jgi:tetratricopeptide (TPR) repeat protein
MKIFLSHSTKDKGFVEKLAAAITASGFEPWLCEVDIEKNENFVAEINEGLTQSDLALLMWSPDAANSRWTEEEWTAALARQVGENKIRLGIVLLHDCPMPLPPLLRTKNYIDARSDEGAGIRDVLDWLKRRHSVQRLSGSRAPVYLPDYRPQDFVGRSDYLEKLRNALTWEPTVFLLYGEPGSGKSMLALRFAWDAQKDFDAVVFQTCGDRSLDAITAELADRLPIDPYYKTSPPEVQRKEVVRWLKARQSLLVLDDVWHEEVTQLEPGPNCSVLYTSRLRYLPGLSSELGKQAESFTESEAEALFHAYLDKDFDANEVTRQRDALLGFARRVEMLPIAVAVGASLLRQKSAMALGRAVLKLRLDALKDGSRDVTALFRTTIESQPVHERELLAAGAICVQEGFWLPLAAEIAGLSEDDAQDAADRLVHSSLLRVSDRERRRFHLHALLREQVRAVQGCDGLGRLQERHATALERIFQAWYNDQDQEEHWRACHECLGEILPAAQFLWNRGEHNRNRQVSRWGFELGRRIGELDVALRIMKQQESLWKSRHDREAMDTLLRSYGNQALILKGWGLLDEALTLHRKAEAIASEWKDKNILQLSYGNQALILRDRGQLEEAMALLKKQEAICAELGYKDSAELGYKHSLAFSYGNQALILKYWGRLDEAMELHKKEEEICLEWGYSDGRQHSYGNQALILKEWGQLEEAMALHKKEEEICKELSNKDSLQHSYGNQAYILYKWKRLAEAMALLKQEEAMCLELGYKDSLAFSYGIQALILKEQGCLEEAVALLKKKEAMCLELGNKISLGDCYANQGLLARAQGDTKTEKEKLEQALAIFTELKMPLQLDRVQTELGKVGRG